MTFETVNSDFTFSLHPFPFLQVSLPIRTENCATAYHVCVKKLGEIHDIPPTYLLIYLLTPWPESARELYRPSGCRLSEKLVPISAYRGCHMVSVTDPYGRILGFLDRTCCVNPIDNTYYAPITTSPSTRTKYSHKILH
jgi:hypothetical protein